MVDEPASPGTTSPPPRKPTPVRRLHEPFVSPEFGANQISPRVDGGMGGDGPERPMTTARNSSNPHHLAAAPLYTVNAACADSHGVLSAPPPALSGSLLLRKRLDVADAGRLSVIGSASGNPLIPASLKSMGFQPTSNNLPPSAPGNVIEATGTVKAPPTSPRDLTPLVTEALCSWGQALRSILGQAVRESVTAERRLQVSSARGPSLMTTGLFPQTMTLRFSSSVRIASVHLRASSVLRVIVQPGEGFVGDGRLKGKTVTVPAGDGPGGWSGEQDINVDLRDVQSFESTRSLTVLIVEGSRAFCSIYGMYALGNRL